MNIKKYLMFDRKWISNSNGFSNGGWKPLGEFNFKTYKPHKSEVPFLIADKPWESMSTGWGTMIYEQGLYRMWYEAWDKTYKSDYDGRLCYAESSDGIHWVKPVLNLVEYQGSKENNIVYDGKMGGEVGFHGHCIFIDPTSLAEYRYRMIYMGRTKRLENQQKDAMDCMTFAYSADGIHWNWGFPEGWTWLHQPYMNFGSDTQSVVFWDPQVRSYVGYFRNWDNGYGRTIGRSVTNDLSRWPLPETILQINDDEIFGKDFYNSAASRYVSDNDSGYFMFISEFNHDTDSLDISLACSRDGRLFKRLDRDPYVVNGETFDRGAMYMCPGISVIGNECVMAYNARHYKHGEANPGMISYAGSYNSIRFPLDRLQGLNTDSSFEFNLEKFKYEGRNLNVNLNAIVRDSGEIRGGLLKSGGREYLQGFSPEECTPITGDKIDFKLSWSGGNSLKDCAGNMVELRLFLKNATVYSVKIEQI